MNQIERIAHMEKILNEASEAASTLLSALERYQALKPRIVIPMHYRHDGHGLAVVAGVVPFLALWDKEAVHREESNTIAITPEKSGVWVPTYHIPE